jgi:hypothetical protein
MLRQHGPVMATTCEPGEPVELHARVVSTQQDGGAAAVVLDVTISSEEALSEMELTGRLQPRGAGMGPGFVLPAGPISRGGTRTERHVLTMEGGRDHDLFLTLLARAPGGTGAAVTAWLPIPLDASRAPRDAGKVLEFRAQPPVPVQP